MSYILDALKRADAERERGHVPGLHSRSAPTLDRPTTQPSRRWLPAAGLIGLALLVAGALGLWWWQGSRQEAPAALAPPAVEPALPSAAAPPPEIAPAAPDATLSTLPILAPELPRPPRTANAAADRPAPPAPVAAGDTAPAAATTTSGAPAASATTPTATNPVRSFAELTPDARAKLPAVNVSGSTFSQNPAHRMLIINGKVVQEGGEIAPGLTLETIEQRSAVLNHQGLRYRIGY